jgi:hypothetical protein
MDSNPVIELLHAAYAELRRLEALLQQNPIYRRVQVLRRLVEEYGADIAVFGPSDPRPDPGSSEAATAQGSPRDAGKVPPSDAPSHQPAEAAPQLLPSREPAAKVSIEPAAPSDSAPKGRHRAGSGEKSQAARIRDATAIFLEKRGAPAKSTEIYKEIHKMGVEVRRGKPHAVVSNALRYSPGLFTLAPDGFGLSAWSIGNGTLPNGKE